MKKLFILMIVASLLISCSSLPKSLKSCDGYEKHPINPEMKTSKTSLIIERQRSCS